MKTDIQTEMLNLVINILFHFLFQFCTVLYDIQDSTSYVLYITQVGWGGAITGGSVCTVFLVEKYLASINFMLIFSVQFQINECN
jgi:hypothetical protein